MQKSVSINFTKHSSQRATERNWKSVPILLSLKDQLYNAMRSRVRSDQERVFIKVSSQKTEVKAIASLSTSHEEFDEISIITILPLTDTNAERRYHHSHKILFDQNDYIKRNEISMNR